MVPFLLVERKEMGLKCLLDHTLGSEVACRVSSHILTRVDPEEMGLKCHLDHLMGAEIVPSLLELNLDICV